MTDYCQCETWDCAPHWGTECFEPAATERRAPSGALRRYCLACLGELEERTHGAPR